MDKFDERYEFRFARLNETERLMLWLDKNWKKEHILSKNKELFLHEFGDIDKLNFFMAIDKISNEIEAIYGILFSSKDENFRDFWGSIWKVIERDTNKNIPFLGIELKKRLEKTIKYRNALQIGINPKTAGPMMKLFFKSKINKMKHYYLLNPNFKINDFKIASITKIPKIKNNKITSNCRILEFQHYSELEKIDIFFNNSIPYKDKWYVKKRFFDYPIYKYNVYGIEIANKIKAIFVIRKQELQGRFALRIVDFIGEQSSFTFVGEFLYSLFDKNIEYIDFYELGFNDEILENLGFVQTLDDENIIPNYFSPFVRQNIDIWTGATIDNVLFCKADGDQDRPN